MVIGNTLPYVYGAYLMTPHLSSPSNNVNKNSFGRLLNSYYGKHSLFKKTLTCTNTSELLEFNEEVKGLRTSLSSLIENEGLYKEGKEEVLKEALAKFVEEYNAVRESFQTFEQEELQNKGNSMDAVTKAYEQQLLAAGIVCKEDGTLTIGEDGLSVKEAEEVFLGEQSFASRLNSKAGILGQEALAMLSPVPKFYGENGSINYTVNAGTLFSTYC